MSHALTYAKQIAYSSEEVLMFTYRMAQKYADTPNSVFCECGVAAGAQIIAMAAGAPNKTIYAFDSFQGIPLASNKDNQAPGIAFFSKAEQMALPDPGKQVLESSGATVVSIEDFTNHLNMAIGVDYILDRGARHINLSNNATIVAVKGWFEEVLPNFECPPICILRLDSDLYNSTYVCLKYLYPKVIKGGIVIIDDWALPGCRAAVEQYFDDEGPPDWYWHQANVNYIKDENSTVAWWIK